MLGRTRSGTLELRETGAGLEYRIALPETTTGNDLRTLAQRGDLGGMSFGFVATDEVWRGDTRELRAVELHEVSVVQAWPAYEQTTVSVRNRPPQVGIFNGRELLWLDTCD